MALASTTQTEQAAYNRYDRITSRWGRITMAIALFFSWAGPFYLVFFSDLDIAQSDLWTGFATVAAVFGVLAVIEPITYYPVLGPAAMYQAFMIGNIANKLLPAAIVGQAAIGAKPGSRRAELAAVMAIGGAAVVHIFSLLILVGVFGTWLVSTVPESITEVARLYIFPAIIGAVVVQLAVYVKSPRITVIALAGATVVQLLLVPHLSALENFASAIVVLTTVVLAWVLRDRSEHGTPTSADRQTQQ